MIWKDVPHVFNKLGKLLIMILPKLLTRIYTKDVHLILDVFLIFMMFTASLKTFPIHY